MKKFKQRRLSKEQKKDLSEFKRNQRKNIGKVIDRKQKEISGNSLKFVAAIMLILLFLKFLLWFSNADILSDREEMMGELPRFLTFFLCIFVGLYLMGMQSGRQYIFISSFIVIVSVLMIYLGYFGSALFLMLVAFYIIRLSRKKDTDNEKIIVNDEYNR